MVRSKNGILISQQKYILDLLKETEMLGCKPADSPIEQNHEWGEAKEYATVDKGMNQR